MLLNLTQGPRSELSGLRRNVFVVAALVVAVAAACGTSDDDKTTSDGDRVEAAEGPTQSATDPSDDAASSTADSEAATSTSETEPSTTGSVTSESASAEPATTKPSTTERPATTKPFTTDSVTTEPSTTKPSTTETSTTETSTTETSTTEALAKTKRRTFSAPRDLTWVDLPVNVSLSPSSAPAPTYSSDSPNICKVSPAGKIEMPTPYDGKKGKCLVRIKASATTEWEAVDEVLTVPLAGPSFVARIDGSVDRSPAWPSEGSLTISFTVTAVTTQAYVDISAGVSGSCEVSNQWTPAAPDSPAGTLEVTVTFRTPERCVVDFWAGGGGGAYDYEISLPEPQPITPIVEAPPTTPASTTTTTTEPGGSEGTG